MIPTLLGIAGAFTYGSADFLGGLASKRLSPIFVTALSAASGLVVLLALYPLAGGALTWSAAIWGGLSGIAGAIALSLLYACLAIGPMSILSPLTAIVSAVVPMSVGLLAGTRFAPIGYAGLGVALLAVLLVGFVPEKGAIRPSLKGIGMAIGSGAMIGVFLILIDQTPTDSGIVPLLFSRAANSIILFGAVGVLTLIAWARRRSGRSIPDDGIAHSIAHSIPTESRAATAAATATSTSTSTSGSTSGSSASSTHTSTASDSTTTDSTTTRPSSTASPRIRTRSHASAHRNIRFALAMAIGCGVVDAMGNVLLLTGIHLGDLATMSVLTAMYPAGTIVLAAVVLRERIAPVQVAGLVLALAAAGMLALG
ncbi:hypothetical protein BH09ACT6_BH09ACT6_21870 [soil metagenome]